MEEGTGGAELGLARATCSCTASRSASRREEPAGFLAAARVTKVSRASWAIPRAMAALPQARPWWGKE